MTIATLPIPEGELPDAIRQLTPLQQEVIRVAGTHPSWDRAKVADVAGCGYSTINSWYWGGNGTTPMFRACYDSIRALSITSLPSMAVSRAREAAPQGMERAIMYGDSLAIDDTASAAQAKLRAIELRFRVAGILHDVQPGATVNLQQLLVQVSQEPAPLGGIWPPKNDDATHEPAGA